MRCRDDLAAKPKADIEEDAGSGKNYKTLRDSFTSCYYNVADWKSEKPYDTAACV